MNECKRDGCSNDKQGKSSYCSESCKTLYNRNKRNTGTGTSQPEQQPEQAVNRLGNESDSKTYATRTNPDLINYGEPMSPYQLEKAGLKANHVSIPGDSDYTGVCRQVEGQ